MGLLFSVKWYRCLEFPANELFTGAQCEQNPFLKLLCSFWKGEEKQGLRFPWIIYSRDRSEKFCHRGEVRRWYFQKNTFPCPPPEAQFRFDILIDFKSPKSFLNRITFLALQRFLGGQLSLSKANKWWKYPLCSQGTSVALGKSFALESPPAPKKRKKNSLIWFSAKVVYWSLLISFC